MDSPAVREEKCALALRDALRDSLPAGVMGSVWTSLAGGEFEDASRDMLDHAAKLHVPIPDDARDLVRDEFLTGDYEPEFEDWVRAQLEQIPAR
ncbi:hypothetical protein LCL87_25050 [Rhodococcus hoagii]|nr:hypothetical protein [Prescottella equi]